MKENYNQNRFDNFKMSVPRGVDQARATRWLSEEFAPSKVEEFDQGLRSDLETSGSDVALNPEKYKRGAEIFKLRNDNGETIAVCMSKYYSWDLIRNQLSYKVYQNQAGEITALSLDRFKNLSKQLNQNVDYSMAVELAYNLIDAKYRGQGLGSRMFDLRINRAREIETEKPKLLFTMARGAYLGEKTGIKILDYLVNLERQHNGENEIGRAVITGIKVPIETIKADLELQSDLKLDQVHNDSSPIVRLAQKAGMSRIGLFKDLSPIFALSLK